MIYSKEVQEMCVVAKGPKHGPAPIPEEGKWVKATEIKDISGMTHGIGWCAPQQGCCKLSLNVKDGVIEEALPAGQNYPRGVEHRPRMRRYQHRYARVVPADRLWPYTVCLQRGRSDYRCRSGRSR